MGSQRNSTDDDWYRDPLYYDIIFDQDTPMEADFVEGAYRRHGKAGKGKRLKILEPACGSARLMVELASRGHEVAGFDLEPAMVSFSQQRLSEAGLDGELRVGRMQNFDMRQLYDLAHCFVSTFKYILDERGARAHLRCVARHLKQDGVYLLGFHLSKYAGSKPETERWKGKRGPVRVDCTIESDPPDPATRIEKVRSHLAIRENKRSKVIDTAWDFRTYDSKQVHHMLAAVPELELVECYDFRYDLNNARELNDDWEDIILVLKKR